MYHKRHLCLLAIVGLALSCQAPLQAAIPPASGWYVEGNVGSSKQQNMSYPGFSVSRERLAGSAALGYKFMPFMGLEGGYSIYSYNRITSGSTLVAKDRFYSYQLAIKGILPIMRTGFEPFAKVGVNRLRSRKQIIDPTLAAQNNFEAGNKSSTGLYLGLGAQYYVMPELAIVAQWARAQGRNDATGSLDLYSVGLSFIFD